MGGWSDREIERERKKKKENKEGAPYSERKRVREPVKINDRREIK
jgi:hypothetical protein